MPTAVMAGHNPEAPAIVGSEERMIEKRRLAFKYRMMGFNRLQIAQRIQEAMSLPEPPPVDTVSRWISEAHKEAVGEMKEMAAMEVMTAIEMVKAQINEFTPMAMGKMHVEKCVMVEGEMMIVIDKDAFIERIKASELVGKHLERLVKFVQVATSAKEDGGVETPGGVRSMQQVIMQENHNYFIVMGGRMPSSIQGEALVLASGDPAIDRLEEGGEL